MTLRSSSLRAWIAALVTILAASAMFATAAAAAGKAKPEVTAIMVSPIHDAQVVRGDDGKDHVEYDLLVVSVVGDPVTLSSVTVLDPAGKELGRIDGDTLAAAYTLAAGAPSAAVLGATEVDGPEVAVNRRPAIVIKQPPLEGNGWLATTACCKPNPHRDLRLALDGRRIETGETFAVDWGLVKGNRLFDGDGSTNEQFYGFGADVLAVADGTVVFTQDGEPEQTPGPPRLAEKQSEIGGNKVILKIAPKVFAAYEHLQPGSLTVKVGDVVKAGALLAKLGNTGPSTGPHLHFGLLDRPDVFTGRSLPFVFDRYTLAGTVDVATAEGDMLPITPESRQVRKAYPLWGSIQNFGEKGTSSTAASWRWNRTWASWTAWDGTTPLI